MELLLLEYQSLYLSHCVLLVGSHFLPPGGKTSVIAFFPVRSVTITHYASIMILGTMVLWHMRVLVESSVEFYAMSYHVVEYSGMIPCVYVCMCNGQLGARTTTSTAARPHLYHAMITSTQG